MSGISEKWRGYLIEWGRRHKRIRQLYVYGSRARGNHEPNSDFDIAVLVSGADQSDIDLYWKSVANDWRKELSAYLPVRVHLELATPQSDKHVWPGVLKDGCLIYTRT